jgi:hypothetical protein
MKKVHRQSSLVNWIINRRVPLMLSLVIALFLVVVVPTRSVGSAATKASALTVAPASEAPTRSSTKTRCSALVIARQSDLLVDSYESALRNGLRLVMLSVPPSPSGTAPRQV